MREFRARQDKLFVEQAQRTDKMTVRVAELERRARPQQLAREGRQRARIDVVTGVPNRSAFEERLHEELERWKRFRTPVSMLVWDIDRFKKINDTYGHRAGDRVLREVANCFANRLRASDFIARIGGEEFCTLLVGTEIEAAMRVANELREAVGSLKLLFHGQPVRHRLLWRHDAARQRRGRWRHDLRARRRRAVSARMAAATSASRPELTQSAPRSWDPAM